MILCKLFSVVSFPLLFCYGLSDNSESLMQKRYKTISQDGIIFYEDFMTFVTKYFLSENDEKRLLTLDHKENVSFIRLLFTNWKDGVSNDTDADVSLTIHDIGEKLRMSHGACKIDKININKNEDDLDSKRYQQLKQTVY